MLRAMLKAIAAVQSMYESPLMHLDHSNRLGVGVGVGERMWGQGEDKYQGPLCFSRRASNPLISTEPAVLPS